MDIHEFNPSPPTIMHIDINSCFATIEQQANPRLRGKPTVVAAYAEDHGCILAASREAKAIGIGTGMRVREARTRCPFLEVLAPDPDKYRYINRALLAILESYSCNISVESIDEMVMDLAQTPALVTHSRALSALPYDVHETTKQAMQTIGREIKERIRKEIGEWITVSIGIAPNRYLAKIASGLHKPDGMDVITKETIVPILSSLQLEDLCGIKTGIATRLRTGGIYSPISLLLADAKTVARALHSIVGHHWWMRLHGYEDGSRYTSFTVGEREQKSFGHAHTLSTPLAPSHPELWQLLSQLVVKMGGRLRAARCMAKGVSISVSYGSYTDHWRAQELFTQPLYADGDLFNRSKSLLQQVPDRPVRTLSVSCYKLTQDLYTQQSLLESDVRKEQVTRAVDQISARFGDFTVTPARMLRMKQKAVDRIAFGKIRDFHRVDTVIKKEYTASH